MTFFNIFGNATHFQLQIGFIEGFNKGGEGLESVLFSMKNFDTFGNVFWRKITPDFGRNSAGILW